jgi:hypothetical protein
VEDPDQFFAVSGPLEALIEAKKAGKIRYIGFTGHKDPYVHLRMLEVAAQHNFCLIPANAAQRHGCALPQLWARSTSQAGGTRHRGAGNEIHGDGNVLKSGRVTPVECLHYALNLPTSVVITGCENMAILDQAIEAARTFQPMSPAEVSALLAL